MGGDGTKSKKVPRLEKAGEEEGETDGLRC